MEVKIGVRDVAREVVLESDLSPDQVAEAVGAAVSGGTKLQHKDHKGPGVQIPGGHVG